MLIKLVAGIVLTYLLICVNADLIIMVSTTIVSGLLKIHAKVLQCQLLSRFFTVKIVNSSVMFCSGRTMDYCCLWGLLTMLLLTVVDLFFYY